MPAPESSRPAPSAGSLSARQRVVLAEVAAEVDTPIPGRSPEGPRWDGLVLDIRNRLAARHRTALATGMEKPEPMLSAEQVAQILTQLADRGLLTVARGADYSRRVRVTELGRAALPTSGRD